MDNTEMNIIHVAYVTIVMRGFHEVTTHDDSGYCPVEQSYLKILTFIYDYGVSDTHFYCYL